MEESLSELFAEEIFQICFEKTLGKLDRDIGSDKERERSLYRCYNLFKKSNDKTTQVFKIIASQRRKISPINNPQN